MVAALRRNRQLVLRNTKDGYEYEGDLSSTISTHRLGVLLHHGEFHSQPPGW